MRLRTVRGLRFPTKCACGCAQRIPPDPDLKVVVDFETSRPRLTYLPTHSPDYGGPRPPARPTKEVPWAPGFVLAKELPEFRTDEEPARDDTATRDRAHVSADASASPHAGRAWATSTLTFNAGQFESVRFGYADYARDGENEAQLRSRVHEVVLAEVERQVRAVRALHERLGDRGVGTAFVRPSAARP